jgi:hypothetical protein
MKAWSTKERVGKQLVPDIVSLSSDFIGVPFAALEEFLENVVR